MMVEDLDYCLPARRAGWQHLHGALALGSEGAAPLWRGYYQSRNQLALSLDRRSIAELWWWSARTTKFCVGPVRSGDRPRERIRLRLLGAIHALRGVSGRTILPDSPALRRGSMVEFLSMVEARQAGAGTMTDRIARTARNRPL